MSGSGAVSEAVARVESELGAFWATAEGESPKVRASTMNYAVVCGPSDVERVREAADQLAETRAGRVFVLTEDGRRAPWDVDATTSAVCHKDGDTVVCYDRIELTFGAMSAARAASVVGALAVGEVPTILEVVPGAPAPLVDALVPIADRVLVDTAHTLVARVAELGHRTRAPIADRAFVRSFSWRELIARFFDGAPSAASAVTSVELVRTPTKGIEPAAIFLGWLAARLGWKFESKELATDASGKPVRITLAVHDREDLGPGEITGVRLTAELDGKELRCHARRLGDARTIEWTRRGALEAEHVFPLGHRDETWVALKAIESTESDRTYLESVFAAARWGAFA